MTIGEDADAGKREQVEEPRGRTARGTGTGRQARQAQQEATEPADGTASSGRGERGGAGQPGTAGRTWTIELPAGMDLLNSNDRDGHWARRKRITAALRQATGWVARSRHLPPLERAYILAVYEPPNRRRRDPANLYPSVKACVDGLVDVGVLPDDDAKHLDGPDMRLGEPYARGRLVLYVSEVAA